MFDKLWMPLKLVQTRNDGREWIKQNKGTGYDFTPELRLVKYRPEK